MCLSEPDSAVIESVGSTSGDILLLGAGGKIGHCLALMARRAFDVAKRNSDVIAVSRFSAPGVREQFENDRIRTIKCDLTEPDAVAALPDAPQVVFMVGQKFGTAAGSAADTWLLNCFVPGLVAERYANSRIVVYSSGNVYPFTAADGDAPAEDHALGPVGEYAQSVLGRERVFESFSRRFHTLMTIVRLNYANEPRYGVLVDVAHDVLNKRPVELGMGHANIVWATDANRITLRSFDIATSPPKLLNLAGPKVRVRDAARRFGEEFGVEPIFQGREADTALLSNGAHCWNTFGPPSVGVEQMVHRVADWLKAGHATWDKPTHFEVRDGKF